MIFRMHTIAVYRNGKYLSMVRELDDGKSPTIKVCARSFDL